MTGSGSLANAPAEKIGAFLEKNFGRAVSLPEAAHVLAMSPSTFSRFFRDAMGRTFVSYLNELRLRHACKLLLETDRGISDIASASGFPSLSYFNRRFRGSRGMAPSDFRISVRRLAAPRMPEGD